MSWFINDVFELSNIAILNIKGSDHCFIISGISKTDAIKLLQNIDLKKWKIEKVEHYKHQEQFWSYTFPRNSNLIEKMEN